METFTTVAPGLRLISGNYVPQQHPFTQRPMWKLRQKEVKDLARGYSFSYCIPNSNLGGKLGSQAPPPITFHSDLGWAGGQALARHRYLLCSKTMWTQGRAQDSGMCLSAQHVVG